MLPDDVGAAAVAHCGARNVPEFRCLNPDFVAGIIAGLVGPKVEGFDRGDSRRASDGNCHLDFILGVGQIGICIVIGRKDLVAGGREAYRGVPAVVLCQAEVSAFAKIKRGYMETAVNRCHRDGG